MASKDVGLLCYTIPLITRVEGGEGKGRNSARARMTPNEQDTITFFVSTHHHAFILLYTHDMYFYPFDGSVHAKA